MNRRLFMVAAAMLFARSAASSAAEYTFVFDPLDAHFSPQLAGNHDALTATVSLLQDYGGAEGVHFILVGALPADCLAAVDCDARDLLKRRVESLSAEVAASADGARLLTLLQWQSVPFASESLHVEGLQLRLRVDPPAVYSAQCPYDLQVTDPRLPAEVAATGDQPPSWVSVRGLVAVPISVAASVRVTSAIRNSGEVTATQRRKDHNARLNSGAIQAQWSASQLNWDADAADVEIASDSQPRDIGNVILPWADPDTKSADSQPADTKSADTSADSESCRLHFVLRH